MTGKMLEFSIFEEKDLPFLDPSKPENDLILSNIIDGDQDDDCATDNELKDDAEEKM